MSKQDCTWPPHSPISGHVQTCPYDDFKGGSDDNDDIDDIDGGDEKGK